MPAIEHDLKHIHGFEDYEREAEKFLDHFAAFITGQFGERCEPADPDCACCRLWALYDQAKQVVD